MNYILGQADLVLDIKHEQNKRAVGVSFGE